MCGLGEMETELMGMPDGLILLRFWICVLMIIAREGIYRLNNYINFFIFVILFLLIMLFLTFERLEDVVHVFLPGTAHK